MWWVAVQTETGRVPRVHGPFESASECHRWAMRHINDRGQVWFTVQVEVVGKTGRAADGEKKSEPDE